LRYFSEEENGGSAGQRAANFDVAIDHLCRELSDSEGPLEQLRLLQEAEDEWAALRSLLPLEVSSPTRWEDRPVTERMEEVRAQISTLRPGIGGLRDDESRVGTRLRILRRLLEEKGKKSARPDDRPRTVNRG
jgi:hypothetical protein